MERSATLQQEVAATERAAACVPPRGTVTRKAIRKRGRHARRRGDGYSHMSLFLCSICSLIPFNFKIECDYVHQFLAGLCSPGIVAADLRN
jgi:hypothetical protein